MISMSHSVSRDPYLLFLMSVSIFELFFLGILALNPPGAEESFLCRKLVIGSIFGLICTLGILATLFPRECSRTFNFKNKKMTANKYSGPRESKLASYKVRFAVRGHHPDCGNFSAHVFKVNNRTFCTSCTGLLLGALITLIATIQYIFNGLHLGQESFLTIYLGVLGVSLGLLQFPLFKNRKSSLRFLLNLLFVLGAFLILIGIDALVRSITLDLFLILSIVFWIFTRMSLSRWDHKRICSACNMTTCEFRR